MVYLIPNTISVLPPFHRSVPYFINNKHLVPSFTSMATKKLTRWQLKAVGSDCPPIIWNSKLSALYGKPAFESLIDDDPTISQSFDEFVEYGNRLPNEEGTGRFIVGIEGRNEIALLFLKGTKSIDQRLVEFISSYFQLPAVSLETELQLITTKGKSKKRSFNDMNQNVSFPLKSSRKGECLEVFSVFDVLVEYIPAKAFTAALLIDIPIAEDGEAVYGRACGDRVAVISADGIDSRREYFTIVIHELLHTFGIDHCESFACIMNPCSCASSTLELCPSELRKLSTAVPGFDCVKRWRELEVLCREEGWIEDAEWFKRRTDMLQ